MKKAAFIRGLQTFASRRETPSTIIYDNFKTFKTVKAKRFFANKGVTNVRLRLAKKHIGKSFLTFEELQASVLN